MQGPGPETLVPIFGMITGVITTGLFFLGLSQLLPEPSDLMPQIFELELRLTIGSAANPLRKSLSDLAARYENHGNRDEKCHRNQCVGNRHFTPEARDRPSSDLDFQAEGDRRSPCGTATYGGTFQVVSSPSDTISCGFGPAFPWPNAGQ